MRVSDDQQSERQRPSVHHQCHYVRRTQKRLHVSANPGSDGGCSSLSRPLKWFTGGLLSSAEIHKQLFADT